MITKKFRVFAKHKDDDGYVGYLESYYYSGSPEGLNFLYDGGIRSIAYFISFPDSFIVEQYTGINDINGKEIYEGDIVQVTGQDDTAWYNPVYFENGMYKLNTWPLNSFRGEVIGNVNDNPELLKEEEKKTSNE